MDLEYLPGGRWVRLLGADGWAVVPLGRWHLAAGSAPVPHGARLVTLVCGRDLRTGGSRGNEIASIAGLPNANVCPACERAWVREDRVPGRRHPATASGALA